MKINRNFHFLHTALLIFLSGFGVLAQPSISASTLLSLNGKVQTFQIDTTLITLDPGTAGENKTWDFSEIDVNGSFLTYAYLDPSDTPYGSSYEDANQCTMISFEEFADALTLYSYSRIENDAHYDIGDVTVSTTPVDTTIFSMGSSLISPLPVTYNSTWTSVDADTLEVAGSGFVSITRDSIIETADAYGTVMVPSGAYNCLRLKSETFTSTKVFVNGIEVSSETYSYIGYNWIADNGFFIASFQSEEGESNPNFSTGIFGRISSGTSAIAEKSPQNVFAMQLIGSAPGSPVMQLILDVLENDSYNVSIRDMKGQIVELIANRQFSAGQHTFRIRKDHFSPGVYLLTIQSGKDIRTLKFAIADFN